MKPRVFTRPSCAGSVTPVIMVFLCLFFLFLVLLFDQFQEAVLTRRGQAAAQAVAVGIVSAWFSLGATAATVVPDPTVDSLRWISLAEGNGVREPYFEAFDPSNTPLHVEPFDGGVNVTVFSHEPGVGPITVQAAVVPAGRMPAGQIYPLGGGLGYPVACLPLGVPVADWTQVAPPNDLLLNLSMSWTDATLVSFTNGIGSTVEYREYLQTTTETLPLMGVAPPAVEIGDLLNALPPALVIELSPLIGGRPQIIPLMDTDEVVGFGVARVLGVDAGSVPPIIHLERIASAVVPGAQASWRANGTPAVPADPPAPDLFFGLALRPQVEFL